MMYVVIYGDTIYGPFHTLQSASLWRGGVSQSQQQNMSPDAYRVREVHDPNSSQVTRERGGDLDAFSNAFNRPSAFDRTTLK